MPKAVELTLYDKGRSVHQLVHQPTRTTPNTHDNLQAIICLFTGISELPRTSVKASVLPYKEGVAGSTPASPTYKLPANSGIFRTSREGREALPGPVAATRVKLSLR